MPFNEAIIQISERHKLFSRAVNKLLKLDKRFIGKDGHVNTILIFNNVSKILRILILFFAIVIDETIIFQTLR